MDQFLKLKNLRKDVDGVYVDEEVLASVNDNESSVHTLFGEFWSWPENSGASALSEQNRQASKNLEGLDLSVKKLKNERTILADLGCGSGITTLSLLGRDWFSNEKNFYIGIDLSKAIYIAKDTIGSLSVKNHIFIRGSILSVPLEDNIADIVVSEGVFHHTPSVDACFKEAYRVLKPGGVMHCWLCAPTAPIRQLARSYICERLNQEPTLERQLKLLKPLTSLGIGLKNLDITIHLTEDVELLNLRAGEYSIYELINQHFLKLYFSDSSTFERMLAFNLDEYSPKYQHRHTKEELESMLQSAGFAEYKIVQPSKNGHSITANK